MNFRSHPTVHDTHMHTQRHRKSTGRNELAATGSYLRNLKVNDFSRSSNPGLISSTATDSVNNMICMPQTCVCNIHVLFFSSLPFVILLFCNIFLLFVHLKPGYILQLPIESELIHQLNEKTLNASAFLKE